MQMVRAGEEGVPENAIELVRETERAVRKTCKAKRDLCRQVILAE
jgi:hypothetical protein